MPEPMPPTESREPTLSVRDDAAPQVTRPANPAVPPAGPASAETEATQPPVPRTAQPRPVDAAEIERIVGGAHHDPHGVLGPHPYDGGVTLRVLRPLASGVTALLDDGSRHELAHEREGVFVGVLPFAEVRDYRLEVGYPDHEPVTTDDPYRFLPTLGEIDLHLIGEGRHEQLWTVLGAHIRDYDGPLGAVRGTSFAVWAPHAVGVRLASDVNHWDPAAHPMRSLGSSGVWELFVPGVGEGTRYKFEILARDGRRLLKSDPMARATEIPPSTASVVTESAYTWGDQEWMTTRANSDPHNGPMSVYEVHLGSWRQGLSYRELADQLVNYVADLGYTHVELMPVMEHPYGPSWGYQVTGYYAPTARFGPPDDFRYLVDTLHQRGIGVILDWVPAHFPKDAFALARFDGQALYEHPDPRRGDQPDWGTHVFDFGNPQVRNFLVANAIYWCEQFHADGLRVDAVASMLYLDYSRKDGEWAPNQYGGREHLEAVQFLQETNATVYKRVPGVVTIAEESTAWPGVTRATHLGGLGFGLKWNMGWMHDSLAYIGHEPVHRQWHHHEMTFSLMYAWTENFLLPISHDEVVHGKGSMLRKIPGDRWKQLATLRAYLALMWSHPGKQLLFMGTEFGQESEWADSRSLDWWLLDQPSHLGMHQMVKDLNRVYRETPALWARDLSPDGFRWIDANDAAGNTFTFIRQGPGGPRDVLVAGINFAGTPHHDFRLGLPLAGRWDEVLNTDAEGYGGSGVGNLGSVEAVPESWHAQPASATVSLPPLGAIWLRPAAVGPDA
jgi:1,4-alpha-glucan branching enzyme